MVACGDERRRALDRDHGRPVRIGAHSGFPRRFSDGGGTPEFEVGEDGLGASVCALTQP